MMIFPFVSRKRYEELVQKLEIVLCHATGGKLSKHTWSINTMLTEIDNHIQDCCDACLEEYEDSKHGEGERMTNLEKFQSMTAEEFAEMFRLKSLCEYIRDENFVFCKRHPVCEKMHLGFSQRRVRGGRRWLNGNDAAVTATTIYGMKTLSMV